MPGAAQVDTYGLLAAILPLTFTIIASVLALAWRLGGLERSLKDTQQRLEEQRSDQRAAQTDLANIRSDVAALRTQVRDVQVKVTPRR